MSLYDYEKIKKLKPGEFRIYNYIMAHMSGIPEMNIRQLAEITGVSTTTVLRFCEKMGCGGYTELKYRIRCGLEGNAGKANYDVYPALQFIRNAEQEADFSEAIKKAAETIARAGQVIAAGDGEGEKLAGYGAHLFNAAGKAAFLCDTGYGGACPGKETGSVLLILSVLGESSEIVSLADRYKAEGVFLVSITNAEQCPIARMSDVNFSCYMPETYGKEKDAMRISLIPAVYILECLAAEVQSIICT